MSTLLTYLATMEASAVLSQYQRKGRVAFPRRTVPSRAAATPIYAKTSGHRGTHFHSLRPRTGLVFARFFPHVHVVATEFVI